MVFSLEFTVFCSLNLKTYFYDCIEIKFVLALNK
jgi:hypothetical protein